MKDSVERLEKKLKTKSEKLKTIIQISKFFLNFYF